MGVHALGGVCEGGVFGRRKEEEGGLGGVRRGVVGLEGRSASSRTLRNGAERHSQFDRTAPRKRGRAGGREQKRPCLPYFTSTPPNFSGSTQASGTFIDFCPRVVIFRVLPRDCTRSTVGRSLPITRVNSSA